MATPYVLLVDDNVEYVDSLADLLVGEGYAVQTAHHGRDALTAIDDSGPPALLLLDLMMPVMDGWELLAKLRAHADPAVAGTRVIVISGVANMSHQRASAEELGCHVMSKPVSIVELLGRIRGEVYGTA